MDADLSAGAIGEEIRLLVVQQVVPQIDAFTHRGASVEDVAFAASSALIAVACATATVEREPGCEATRQQLHRMVDMLFDQLASYRRGEITKTGETVQ